MKTIRIPAPDVTQEELLLIRKFQKWSLIYWIWIFVEHLPKSYVIQIDTHKSRVIYFFALYNIWFWIWSFIVVCGWYCIDPFHRPNKFRSVISLQIVFLVLIFNFVWCFFWNVIDCWVVGRCIDFFEKEGIGYGIVNLIGVFLIYASFVVMIIVCKIAKQLYDLWKN